MNQSEIIRIGIIKGNMKDIDVIGKINSKNNEPTPTKRHAITTISDGSGKTRLSLWNNQVDQVNVGDFVFVSKAFIKKDMGRVSLQTWTPIIQRISKEEAIRLGFSENQ
jgi:hypothetical protein